MAVFLRRAGPLGDDDAQVEASIRAYMHRLWQRLLAHAVQLGERMTQDDPHRERFNQVLVDAMTLEDQERRSGFIDPRRIREMQVASRTVQEWDRQNTFRGPGQAPLAFPRAPRLVKRRLGAGSSNDPPSGDQ
jgi:hypothetical protein